MKIVALSIFFLLFILPVSTNALIYDNGVEVKSHNCMTAVPYGYQKYTYVPCDTPQNSIQNFNTQRSQPAQNPSVQNDKGGFIEEVNPNTRQGQTELPPIVTHIEVQHAIMHEITNQVNEEPNYTNWYWVGIGIVVLLVIIVSVAHRRGRRINEEISYAIPQYRQNTRTEYTRQGNDDVQTQIEEEHEIRNWNEELWKEVKTKFPRDWEKILKWISENSEDVNIIIKNSKDNRDAIKRMVKEAYKNLDWDDLR